MAPVHGWIQSRGSKQLLLSHCYTKPHPGKLVPGHETLQQRFKGKGHSRRRLKNCELNWEPLGIDSSCPTGRFIIPLCFCHHKPRAKLTCMDLFINFFKNAHSLVFFGSLTCHFQHSLCCTATNHTRTRLHISSNVKQNYVDFIIGDGGGDFAFPVY